MADKEMPLGGDSGHETDLEEHLIWEGSPSWKVDFGKYVGYGFLALVLAIAAVVAGVKLGSWFSGFLAALVILLVVALYLGWITLVRRSTQYRITNLSIQIREGIFTTSIRNLETWRIRDSTYLQSVMEKILGIGRVVLKTQDADTPIVELTGLPDDRDLYDKIKNAYVVARQRRNVLGLVE